MQQLFDELGDLLKTKLDDSESPFKSFCVLKETFGLIVGKGGRPDHSATSSSDSIISYTIGLYVFKYDKAQIRNNRMYKANFNKKDVDKWGGRFVQKKTTETRPVLGSRRGIDARTR